MRCPKCGLEINPHSERCTNCGTSAKLAKPDGDTMTRVRRQIAVVRRQQEPSDENYADASFSPVMKFEKEGEGSEKLPEENPAENFEDPIFTPVDLGEWMNKREESEAEARHRSISAEIRSMVRNKEDDLLAEYYFRDGISDLERYRPISRGAESRKPTSSSSTDAAHSDKPDQTDEVPPEEQMSEAAKRLNTFPEESGLDKVLTFLFEKMDRVSLKVKGFFQKSIVRRVARLYEAFDNKTAPLLDKLLDKFYAIRFGKLSRRSSDSPSERKKVRRTVWSVCVTLVIVLLCVGLFVTTLFTDSITGKWVVSYDVSDKPNVIMEFKPGGSAVISVRSDDGWHVHKQGRYKTQRKNGHDMLTITYEDGTVSRLYYIIEGKSGTFINVDTNVEVVYDLK